MDKNSNIEEGRRVGRQLSVCPLWRIEPGHSDAQTLSGTFGPDLSAISGHARSLRSCPAHSGRIRAGLGMDNGTLTPLLKRLQSAGLVTRTRDQQDERRVLIDLTDAGEALRETACSVPEKIETACRLTHKDFVEQRDTLNGLGHPRQATE